MDALLTITALAFAAVALAAMTPRGPVVRGTSHRRRPPSPERRRRCAEEIEQGNHLRRLDWIGRNRARAEEGGDAEEIRRFDALLRAEESRHLVKLREIRARAG